jgi:glycerol-1-phosphate dehydrogenase [NAD(P)+]
MPLVEGLMLGGFAMQWSRTSRPASGAEHQFSHLSDMEHHTHHGQAPSHGFKVGIATLAITRFYEQLLAADIPALDVERCLRSWPDLDAEEARTRRMFAETDFIDTALKETRAKHIPRAELRSQLERLKSTWPELRLSLQEQLLPSADMKRRLHLAGAPVEPEQIGISRERLRDSFHRAYHIRRRFTVLDLAMRTGMLETLLEGLFGTGAVWSIDSVTKGGRIFV